MDISGCSFLDLPYSKLFHTYLTDFNKLSDFYPANPLDDQQVARLASGKSSAAYLSSYIPALADYHKSLGIEEDQKAQLEKLASDDAMVIVTGQQLGIYGGPLFTIYKTATAILLARKWEKKTGRPVVPVFWLADEDHDFNEIAWAGILGRKDYHKVQLDKEGNGLPVADQLINSEFLSFKEEVAEELFDTDFTDKLWDQLEGYYKEGNTHVQAFARLMNEWFAGEGVLIAGSNYPAIKDILVPEIKRSVTQADALFTSVEEKTTELEKEYHAQVVNGDTNLFYIDEEEGRIKMHRDNDHWSAGELSWTEDELLKEIEDNPHRFSPNVFLRPIFQDKLLPTLGYVAGPGELAYYGQMKSFYSEFDLEMPVIFPRLSITLIESGITRIWEKLPFNFCEYNRRIEDLESDFIEQSDTPDLEALFGEWKNKIEASAEKPLEVINEIDPTLDGTVGKTIAGFSNELDRLKGRVYRSIKQQEETQIKRIEKIKVNLFPDGGLQERAVSPVYFMNKYGLDIWSNLIDRIEEEGLDLSRHHLIKL